MGLKPAALIAKAVAMGADIHRGECGLSIGSDRLWICASPADYPGGNGVVVYTGRWSETDLERLKDACRANAVSPVSGHSFIAEFISGGR